MELLVILLMVIGYAIWPPLGFVPFILYAILMIVSLIWGDSHGGRVKRPTATMEY